MNPLRRYPVLYSLLSVANCFVNLLGGLIAYTWREKKPSLNIRVKEQLHLPALVF